MNGSYRLGLSLVMVTVAMSSLLCVSLVDPTPDRGGAAEHLEVLNRTLGPFRVVERSGRAVTDADLADGVWVAAFVFSRCQTSCPVISRTMRDIQADLAGTSVRLASISVDPDHDTPAVLREFASRYGADRDRWLYLTGLKDEVYRLILDRFLIDVAASTTADRKEGAEMIAHSDRLVLVGPGNRLLGAYDSRDPKSVRRLEETARFFLDRRAVAARTGWVLRLPALNASLNGSCAILLLVGWALVRSGHARGHVACMATAIVVSALFLACYLVYHHFVGSVPFQGVGPVRIAYLAILLSHTLLAIAVVPMIALTVVNALRGRYDRHVRIARVTFPVWMYVSVTGVVVYWMLYRMPIAIPTTA